MKQNGSQLTLQGYFNLPFNVHFNASINKFINTPMLRYRIFQRFDIGYIFILKSFALYPTKIN